MPPIIMALPPSAKEEFMGVEGVELSVEQTDEARLEEAAEDEAA